MDPLELICPSCERVLVLDAGFAGGVCRCSNCGMLMSVPTPASAPAQRPSSTRRPNLPGEPVATPAGATPTRATKPARPLPVADAPKPKPSTTAPAGKSRASRHRPGRAQSASLHKRKRVILVSVIGIIILSLIVLIFAFSGFVHYQANRPPPGHQTPQQRVTFEYDPNTNPYLLDKPNLLGIPISPKTVMVVETSQNSRPWLGLVKNAILTGTNFDSSVVAIQLVFATADGVVIFPDKPETLDQLDRDSLRSQLNQILSMGNVNSAAALQRALGPQPEQLILVTGQKPLPETIRHLQTLLKLLPDARFDAVLIDTQSTSMISLPRDRGGQYITLSAKQLQNWRYQTQ